MKLRLGASIVVLALCGQSSWAAPPSPGKIFACPLGATRLPKPPSPQAATVPLPTLGLQMRLPQWLKVKSTAPQRVDLASRSWRLSLRRSRQAPKRGAGAVKTALERYELRASHISSRCERTSLERLLPKASLVFTRARLGVHTRPLGQRRRSYALYLELRDGTVLTAVLTGFWRGSKAGPTLHTALELLARVAAATPVGVDPKVPGAE